ncbi:tyrosine-type recombinase/integrase [Streptomyces sp. NPDC101160]|uniref:tyrosine-type recombinase/integrase n=1 Tax=Streptomyces sp. NPDC101160 TaxID=3366118 RepID=UPI00380E1B01
MPSPRTEALPAAPGTRRSKRRLAEQRLRLHRADGVPVEPATPSRHFASLPRSAGFRRIRFHDLRHSTAALLLEQRLELVVTKELLGHAHRRHRHRLRPRSAPPPAPGQRHPQ